MLRTDALLLAYLALHIRPERRDAMRAELRGQGGSLSGFGQALIRAKVLSPQEFLACRAAVESARWSCARCRRAFVAFPGAQPRPRRCSCGHVNRVPAVSERGAPNPFSTHPEREQRLTRRRSGSSDRRPTRGASSRRGAKASGRGARGSGRGARGSGRGERASGKAPALEPAELGARRAAERIGGYPVVDKVGGGGMGDVYRVKDKAGRIVALKLLRGGSSRDAEERFRREAQALARLTHPAIVQVHDVGADERGRPFFTMDYVEGRELAAARPTLSREAFLSIVARIAEGLHYAHEQGIIHRDVKPQNILIAPDGSPKLADFGLARDLGRSSLTEDGDLVGTPLFMAPEQLRGDPSGIDRRTDVYALGVLLYEGLTDRLPIEATSFLDLQDRIAREVPAPPSEHAAGISADLDRIVLKALEKRPDDRYPTAGDLAADLRRVLAGEEVAARPISTPERLARRAAGLARSPWGAAALALLLLALGGAAWLVAQREEAAREERRLAELRERQDGCLERLTAAQTALQRGQDAVARGERTTALTAAAEAAQAAAQARERARALGRDAPPGAVDDAGAVRRAAERLRARLLTEGGPAERAEARALLQAQLTEGGADAEARLILGRLELEAGHVTTAFQLFNDVLALEEGRLEAYVWRGEAHRRGGKARFALFDHDRALADPTRLPEPLRGRAFAARARARVDLGALEDAARDLAEAQRVAPREPLVRLTRAALLQARGERGAALHELELATREVDSAELRRALGVAWAELGDLARGQRELDRSLTLSHAPEGWLVRGRLRALVGRDAEAADDLAEAARRTAPEDPARAATRLVEARALRARGEHQAALAALEPAIGPPAAGEVLEPRTRALLLERAEVLIARGSARDLDLADRDLARLLAADPRDVRALLDTAAAALRRGDPPLARAQLERLAPEARRDPEALALAAQLAPSDAELGARAAAAQEALVEAFVGPRVEVGPPREDALFALSWGRRLVERAASFPAREEQQLTLEAALPHLERAVALAPWLGPARLALAEALAQRERREEALAQLAQAPALGRAGARAQELRGELLAAAARHAPAVRAYDAALALLEREEDTPAVRGRVASLLLRRARSHTELADAARARADLDRALELDPLALEAFELRAELRDEAGDAAGAAADRERVTLLRSGYVAVYDEARRAAWREGVGTNGDHTAGLRVLAPAFELVSARRDPARRAELHMLRGYLRLRSFDVPGAMVDLAAIVELAPQAAFRHLFDEVLSLRGAGGGIGLDLDQILRQSEELRAQQADVDPDLFVGLVAFVDAELRERPPEARLRGGVRALSRYLDRRPTHPGARLMRAALLLRTGQLAEALADAVVALQEREPPGFAWYVLARIQAAQRDVDGALRSLGSALLGGFDVYVRYSSDPALARLRGDPRYELVLELSQGAGYLAQAERAERLALERAPRAREEVYAVARQALTTGLGFLRARAEQGEPQALALAARLHLARARQQFRLSERAAARRDLLAALEASPTVLLDFEQARAAWDALGPLPPDEVERTLRDARGTPFPSAHAAPLATAWRALMGAEVPASEVAAAHVALAARAHEQPRLEPYLALVRQAERKLDAALLHALARRDEPQLAGVCAWFAARVHAAQGRDELALADLSEARAGGLSGPIADDPALARLAGRRELRRLFPNLPPEPAKRWAPE